MVTSAAGSDTSNTTGAADGVSAASVTTTTVRCSASESRPVTGSRAVRRMTFEPGTRATVTLNAPSSSASTVGFSRRLSTVIVAFGAVTPRMVMVVSV